MNNLHAMVHKSTRCTLPTSVNHQDACLQQAKQQKRQAKFGASCVCECGASARGLWREKLAKTFQWHRKWDELHCARYRPRRFEERSGPEECAQEAASHAAAPSRQIIYVQACQKLKKHSHPEHSFLQFPNPVPPCLSSIVAKTICESSTSCCYPSRAAITERSAATLSSQIRLRCDVVPPPLSNVGLLLPHSHLQNSSILLPQLKIPTKDSPKLNNPSYSHP